VTTGSSDDTSDGHDSDVSEAFICIITNEMSECIYLTYVRLKYPLKVW